MPKERLKIFKGRRHLRRYECVKVICRSDECNKIEWNLVHYFILNTYDIVGRKKYIGSHKNAFFTLKFKLPSNSQDSLFNAFISNFMNYRYLRNKLEFS